MPLSIVRTSVLLTTGGLVGAALTVLIFSRRRRSQTDKRSTTRTPLRPALQEAEDRRQLLPSTIILVRHGESVGNADSTQFSSMPDNLLPLTDRGIDQAKEAGRRVESILSGRTKSVLDVRQHNNNDRGVYLNSFHSGKLLQSRSEIGFGNGTGTTSDSFHPLYAKNRRVHFVLSPFERTLQTARAMRTAFEHRIVRTDIESRIREQEFGNVQTEDFRVQREEQQKNGRFWYRFATGESGADVYDRVKSWWFESVLNVNTRIGYEPIDAMVVVTHGLTMRFVLMQLFSWSPTTFHSVWNADNCDLYGEVFIYLAYYAFISETCSSYAFCDIHVLTLYSLYLYQTQFYGKTYRSPEARLTFLIARLETFPNHQSSCSLHSSLERIKTLTSTTTSAFHHPERYAWIL